MWYEHTLDGVISNGNIKILWDFNIQCEHETEARRPSIVVVDEDIKECRITDGAVSSAVRFLSKSERAR